MGFFLELLLDDAVVSVALLSPDSVQVLSSRLISTDWLLNVQWVHLCVELELQVKVRRIHSEVRVMLDFFLGLGWCALGLLDPLIYPFVFLTVNALVLEEVSGALLVGLSREVVLDLLGFLLHVVLVHRRQSGVWLLLFSALDLTYSGVVSLFIRNHRHLWGEVRLHGCWTTSFLGALTDRSAVATDCDGDLVDALKDLEAHHRVILTKVLRLEGDVDCVLHVGKQFSFCGVCLEMGDLWEAEVDWKVEVFVLDSERHIASLVGLAFPECEVLAVDLDLWVLGTSHHLDLKVCMLKADLAVLIELDNS